MQHIASKMALILRGTAAINMTFDEKIKLKKSMHNIIKSYTAAHPRTTVFPATPQEFRPLAMLYT